MGQTMKVPCVILRGGTSKGIYLKAADLPKNNCERDDLICKIFGSPDVRQIDGLGGADPLTSKCAIIGPPSRPDADVDYTFGQVSITAKYIDYSGNCGNISAGVGPFAIDEGLVTATEGVTRVRIHNTNTGKIIVAEVPTVAGKAAVTGEHVIAGVPGTGAKIMLDYSDTAGAVTGKLLPTGNSTDVLVVEGFGQVVASIVDAANVVIFVRAKDIGLTGIETPKELGSRPDMLNLLEKIRGTAAVKIGMAKNLEDALQRIPAFPMLAFVSPATDYQDFTTGQIIKAAEMDFVSRLMFMQVMHKTYAGTGTICTGVAAKIPGTVVNELASASNKPVIKFGHPAGIIEVEVATEKRESNLVLTRAAMSRTARRIMDGNVYVGR
ncbi:2-methylaconitate cis-trans isomerase PrpF family protein [Sporomusa acidovorans]|uniref:3-methylitaconate isomerase n=1 Tax=Sporomusa acidovorans (strain ATCC 49682 / DSM 3132 / Mol) TaxID=1123286 RepID=A0ABZ3J289_SPOA4|nr:PrpF domain-containing protein [Sporomusa acidovorans]OZC19964.1 3-methylitaconate isomerase [Sporomusa acidovorans DSM 3132]SDD48925.1 methylitaconate delta2-delta3-isomerase [Sporomusa acidovorans]